jgi:hypothetical protein
MRLMGVAQLSDGVQVSREPQVLIAPTSPEPDNVPMADGVDVNVDVDVDVDVNALDGQQPITFAAPALPPVIQVPVVEATPPRTSSSRRRRRRRSPAVEPSAPSLRRSRRLAGEPSNPNLRRSPRLLGQPKVCYKKFFSLRP